MKLISLNGNYKLQYVDHNSPIGHILKKDFVADGWLDTEVPEDVRTVLRRYGYISGHYYGKDVDAERWIDQKDWIYHKNIYVDEKLRGAENILVFNGIDTLAEIFVNGIRIGKCENMHMTYSFDVSPYLEYGTLNSLVIRVLSPLKSIENVDRSGLYPTNDTSRLLVRKSQMNYGWDFCGYCLTTGIWKDVYLLSRTHESIEDIHVYTESINDKEAMLSMQMEMSAMAPDYEVLFEMRFNEEVVHKQKGTVEEMENYSFHVNDPQLWWPHPYGEPNLYTVVVKLYFKGEMVDSKKLSIGIRTVELQQEKLADGGHSFIFVVNGKKIFVRGANWVPINAVYGEITDKEYEYYLSEAINANLSMLRIWGGGIYESDTFFDLCDRHGIMVFQDFMLACGIFPQDDHFVSLVEQEAEQIVKKYRNRASLVIWSGDNEVDQSYGWYDQHEDFDKNRLNRVAISEAVQKHDGTRPYLASSPTSPLKKEIGYDDPNSALQGDMHIYLPRFHKGSEHFYKKITEFVPRFMSEYGFCSLPSKDSYKKFNFFQNQLDINRDPHFGELDTFAQQNEKEDYDSLIETTQYSHAQALKYWIEYMRSYKWTCSGSLYWKFNDPIAPNRPNMLFPTLMSSVDFYGKRKLAYYYSRRAYEDTIIAFREDNEGHLSIMSCNETEQEYEGNLVVSIWGFSEKTTIIKEEKCIITGDESNLLVHYSKEQLEKLKIGNKYIKVTFKSPQLYLENRYMLMDIEDYLKIELPETDLKVDITSITEDGMSLSIKNNVFAKDVQIEPISVSERRVEYSDNGFDMDAESKKEVTIFSNFEDIEKVRIKVKATNSSATILNLCDYITSNPFLA